MFLSDVNLKMACKLGFEDTIYGAKSGDSNEKNIR